MSLFVCGVTSLDLNMSSARSVDIRDGDTFFIDEVFVKIQGQQQYLWRAVDQDGEVVDLLPQARRDGKAAKRFSNAC